MSATDYRSYWDRKAGNEGQALAAVDNSGSERVARATGAWTAAQLRSALDIRSDDRVLELGCGAGRIGRELAGDCGQWVGTDISPRMLDVARERLSGYANVELVALQRSSLEMVPDDSIDKTYSVAVLCHMDKEDLFLYLRDLRRVLKPGGLAYLETWNMADAIGWQRWMYEVEHWHQADQSQRKYVSRNQFCVPEEFRLYARRAGFGILAQFADSPWIQLVVGKALDMATENFQRTRLAEQRHAIAYSPMFGQLFGATVPVIYGQRHPRDLLADLDALPQCPEVELHRIYILGLWQGNTEQWGDLPEGSG